VAKHYRTKSGAENTGLGGFSYGGVSALYTVIAKPRVFGKLLLESTPLWIGSHYELLRDAKSFKLWPASVYLGSGSNETDERAFNQEGEKNQKLLGAIIEQNSKDTRLKIVRESGATHGTAAWRQRLSAALQFLYAK
jgi:predicted alpha/beta superfamily hydrolase